MPKDELTLLQCFTIMHRATLHAPQRGVAQPTPARTDPSSVLKFIYKVKTFINLVLDKRMQFTNVSLGVRD